MGGLRRVFSIGYTPCFFFMFFFFIHLFILASMILRHEWLAAGLWIMFDSLWIDG